MANAANGNVVLAGDEVTVLGSATAISGSGQTASVTVKDRSGVSFTVTASDCAAPQGIGAAISRNGKPFGVGADVTIPATIVSIAESGSTSQSTVKTTSNTVVVNTTTSAASPKNH